MKKTVLAILAGMVCAISFACISGGDDYSGDNGNADHGSMPGDSSDLTNGVSLKVQRVQGINYLAYDFTCDHEGSSRWGAADVRLIFRGSPNKTIVYIAEIDGNIHTENPGFSVNDGAVSFSATLHNQKVVHLPIKVKVGIIQAALAVGKGEFSVTYNSDGTCVECGFHKSCYQARYADILSQWRASVRNTVADFSLVLQYQVAGDYSWTTVSRTRFSDLMHQSFQWQNKADGIQMSKPKYYFLNGQIDGDFPVGTTLLIRIVAESLNNGTSHGVSDSLQGWEDFGTKKTWSKVMTGTDFTSHSSSSQTAWHKLTINGFTPGLGSLYSIIDEIGNVNWCPLQWMAVMIGEGRKPE